MTPFTMEELDNAIHQLKKAKLQTREVSTQRCLKYSPEQSNNNSLYLYNTVIQPNEEPPPNSRDTTIKKSFSRAQAHHHHPTAGPPVRSPSCTHSSASSSSNIYNPHWTPVGLSTKHQTRLLHDRPLLDVPVTRTGSHRVAQPLLKSQALISTTAFGVTTTAPGHAPKATHCRGGEVKEEEEERTEQYLEMCRSFGKKEKKVCAKNWHYRKDEIVQEKVHMWKGTNKVLRMEWSQEESVC